MLTFGLEMIPQFFGDLRLWDSHFCTPAENFTTYVVLENHDFPVKHPDLP